MRFNQLFLLCFAKSVLCNYLKECIQRPAVKRLQEYLQIDTSQKENDIWRAVRFWRQQASDLKLSLSVYMLSTKPLIVITWEGTDPSLPSIMLNSRLDVAAVDARSWTHPPFEALVDAEGYIYGHGVQYKGTGIQYMEAIRMLKENNIVLRRTIYITLIPEDDGFNGIGSFIKTKTFKELNVGFALDNGIASADGTLLATYLDKRSWQMNITIGGTPGKAYQMLNGTAMEKVHSLLDIIHEFRKEQQQIEEHVWTHDYGAYTSVNVNMITGNFSRNQLPERISVIADLRLATTLSANQALSMVGYWLKYAGNNTSLEFIRQDNVSMATRVDKYNPFWTSMLQSCKDMGVAIKPVVSPDTTDLLAIRGYGIPAIGFSPRVYISEQRRVKGSDEYIYLVNFLQGINVYANILMSIANCTYCNYR